MWSHALCNVPEHFADELEEELDSALENDFNVEAEDDSPHEVRKIQTMFFFTALSENQTCMLSLQCFEDYFGAVLGSW